MDSILSSSFYHAFIHWHESADHEFLRAYLACIFIVSTADADPISKLVELESEQHKEQVEKFNLKYALNKIFSMEKLEAKQRNGFPLPIVSRQNGSFQTFSNITFWFMTIHRRN